MVGLSVTFSALRMWSFILPLPQSMRPAGTVTCTAFTPFSPVNSAGIAFGPLASTTASTSSALQVKERIVDVPSIQRRLCGCSTSCSLATDQAPEAGTRIARASRVDLILVRIVGLLASDLGGLRDALFVGPRSNFRGDASVRR